MKNRKIIYTVGIIVVIAIIVVGVDKIKQKYWPIPEGCTTDISALLYDNPSGEYLQPSFVARKIFTQYLNSQKALLKCKDSGLKDFTITSIGDPYFKQDGFMIKVKIDFEPIFPNENLWATKETTRDGSWVRGKEFNLGIRQASTTYMLVP